MKALFVLILNRRAKWENSEAEGFFDEEGSGAGDGGVREAF